MIDKKKFATKKELIAYIIKNKAALLHLKNSTVKHCDNVLVELNGILRENKIITTQADDDLEKGVIYRTVIGNTYGWMDSHDDVHIPGIFTKSISENKNIAHLHDHIFQLDAKVGDPQKIYEAYTSWKTLGIDRKGNATCLLMDTEIQKEYNEKIFRQYFKNKINQHSVGMMYVKLCLCVNDEEYKEEFANWNTYISYVANEDKAIEQGYFWAVTEAKLREISCVIAGSNELTQTMEPGKATPLQTEPPTSTQKEIPYDYLIKNLTL